ncbi:MAG: hypothetical protein OXT65_06855 [Alphaproteobacteria bacterium]|nr:hypothetical protein [Alphaproteobacteria bacterium]
MTDTTQTSAPPTLRAQFSAHTRLVKTQAKEAKAFINLITKGEPISPETAKKGQELLQNMESGLEVERFNRAVLAGQEALDEADLDARVDKISKALHKTTLTTERLRAALETL